MLLRRLARLLFPRRLACREGGLDRLARHVLALAVHLAQLPLEPPNGRLLVLERGELAVVVGDPLAQALHLGRLGRQPTHLAAYLTKQRHRVWYVVERAVEREEGGLRRALPPGKRIHFRLEGADHGANLRRALLRSHRAELADDLFESIAALGRTLLVVGDLEALLVEGNVALRGEVRARPHPDSRLQLGEDGRQGGLHEVYLPVPVSTFNGEEGQEEAAGH